MPKASKIAIAICVSILAVVGFVFAFTPPPLDESNAAELAEDEISVNINSNVPLQQWKAVGPQNADGSLIAGNDGNGDAAWSYVANGNYIVNNANQSPLSGYIHPNVNLSEFDLYTTIGSWDQDDDFMGVMFCTKTYGVNNWDSYYFLLDGPPGTPLGSWNAGTGASAGLYKTKNATLGSWARICATNTHALKWVREAYVQLHVKVAKTAENKPHIQIWFNNKLEIDYVDDSATAILDGSIGFWSMSQPNARFKDVRYTARLATYTVKLEANGNDVHMDDTTPVQGIHTKTWKKDLPTPTRNGYIFKGWNTKADGTGTDMTNVIKAGAPVNVSSDITLYAQWEKNPFIIEATPNVDGHGSATVSWPSYDYRNKNFKVYQSSDGGGTWNSVGIDYTSVTNVRCLQVYPCDAAKNQLKEWVVNSGYGQGKISVDAVSQEAFNMSSETILKDEQGNYRYDVLYFGTWDANDNKDMVDASVKTTADFIKSGRGVIFGHDCLNNWIGTSAHNEKFNDLIGLCGVTAPEKVAIIDSRNYTQTKIKISQTGLMTNYPNFIGNVGQILDVPATHITGFSTPNSRVWYSFDESILEAFRPTFDDMLGYCSTYNNTALLSTGHSNNQATPDEQKILANLIFYMNQLLFDSGSLRDASAQDVAAPAIHGHCIDSDGSGTVSFDSEDFGTTYSYYAESYTKDDTTETGKLATSNIADTTVTTGVSKYYYIFDDNADTEITDVHATGIAEADANNISYAGSEGKYMHIVAVDGAGNTSTTYTLRTPAPADAVFEVSKEMKDGTSMADGEFSFQLYQTSVDDYTTSGSTPVIDTTECNANGKAILSASGENAIKHPGIYAYSIREVNDGRSGIVFDPHLEAVLVQASDNGDGTLRLEYSYDMSDESDSTKGILFQNTRASAPLVVEKTSSGVNKKYENREYEFVLELRDSQGVPVSDVAYHRTSENNDMGKKEEIENGLISSGDVFWLRAGEEMMLETTDGTSYKVTENLLPGYTVETLNDMGTLNHDFDGDTMFQTAAFRNVYSAIGTPSGIGGIVRNEDAKVEEGQYEFKLISPDGDDVSVSRNEGDGSFKFEFPAFDAQDDDKTFTYVIRQQVPDEPGGYIYDEEEELVHITVIDNGNGTLSFDVVYEKGGEQSSSPIPFENSYSIKMPETGMGGAGIGVVLGGLLVIIALCGIGTTFKHKRRKNVDDR